MQSNMVGFVISPDEVDPFLKIKIVKFDNCVYIRIVKYKFAILHKEI